jgi:hypothetical protein
MNTPSCPPAETDPNAVGTPHHAPPRPARLVDPTHPPRLSHPPTRAVGHLRSVPAGRRPGDHLGGAPMTDPRRTRYLTRSASPQHGRDPLHRAQRVRGLVHPAGPGALSPGVHRRHRAADGGIRKIIEAFRLSSR